MHRTSRPLVAALLATLTCSGIAILSGSTGAAADAATATAAGRTPLARVLRIGTFNIRAGVSFNDFNAAADAFKPSVDVAGFQEIGQIPKRRHLEADHAWGVFAADEMEQNPVIWRRADFDLVGGHGFKLADGANIDDERGVTNEVRKPTYATIVRLVDRATGQRLSIVNVHLVPGAVKAGHPVPGRPKLFRLYSKQVAGSVRAVKAERAVSDRVYILGDFNAGYKADVKQRHKRLPYRRFKAIGATSMWKGSPYLDTVVGTHEDALIDQVWTTGRATSTDVMRGIKQSDHFPAVATYALPEPALGYRATTGDVGFVDLARSHDQKWANGDRPSIRFSLTGDLRHGYNGVEAVDGAAVEGKDYTVDDSGLWDSDLAHNDIVVTLAIDKRLTNPEDDETFSLRLIDPVNTVLQDGRDVAVGTIVSNK